MEPRRQDAAVQLAAVVLQRHDQHTRALEHMLAGQRVGFRLANTRTSIVKDNVLINVDSAFVLHGALIGIFGILLFTVMWVGTTGSLAQPALYVVAHALKSVEGIAGGLIAERRHSRGASATRAATR